MMIGDEFVEIPTYSCEDPGRGAVPMLSRVVYIHPQRRFYTVEFRSPVTGETFRESFYFADRRHKPRRTERTKHENDCDF